MTEQYITLAETEFGLVITLTEDGRDYLAQRGEHDPVTGRMVWAMGTNDLLRNLLDSQQANDMLKNWYWGYGNDYAAQGWLTSAPVWVTEPEFDADGDLADFEHAYWFPDYAVRDEVAELLENGYVIFPECPE